MYAAGKSIQYANGSGVRHARARMHAFRRFASWPQPGLQVPKLARQQESPQLICAGVAEVGAVLLLQVEAPQGQSLVVCAENVNAGLPHDLEGHLVEPPPCLHLLTGQLLLGQRPAVVVMLVAPRCSSLAVIKPPVLHAQALCKIEHAAQRRASDAHVASLTQRRG